MNISQLESLSNQIATRQNTINFVASAGMMLPNPDPILRALGKNITVYRDLRTDPNVGGNIKRKKGAVKALEWGVNQGSAKSRSAKTITDLLADLDMDRIISEILDATLYGYQPLEVIWGNVGSLWLPVDIVGKPPEWFLFDTENQFRLRTLADPVYGELLPPNKFLLPRQEPTYDNPYGMPDLAMCFWPTTFKKGGLKFWVTFTEKYGSPWVIGKHPRNTPTQETDDLLQQLYDMVQDAVAVIPDDSSVEIKEAIGKASSADVYERMLTFCVAQINYALLGQNQASEASSNKASAQAGLEVTQDIRDADSRLVESTFNTLIKWIYDLNFNDSARPVFSMWEQESVDKTLAERDETLSRAGLKFTPAYFKRTYNLQDGDIEETLTQQAPTNAAFAESDSAFTDQEALDAALTGLMDHTQGQTETMLKPLIKFIDGSADFADATDKLATIFPKLDASDIEEALTRAMFTSKLHGYANGED